MKLVLIFLFVSSVIYTRSISDTLYSNSGLKYIILKTGEGAKAKKGNDIEVHYTGKFLDGKIFDSSYDRNEPITFELLAGQMLPGFDEGVSLMSVGDKYRLIIPYQLGYGESGSGNIPPKATLIFDIELLSLQDYGRSLSDTLWSYFNKNGIDKLQAEYEHLKKENKEGFDFREKQLRDLGNIMLLHGKFEASIKVFELNRTLFPESGYVYDSLGEAYVMQFKVDEAIEYYKIALEKDPNVVNSKKMIKLLMQEKQNSVDSTDSK